MTFLRHGTQILRHGAQALEHGAYAGDGGGVGGPTPLAFPWPVPESASTKITGFALDWDSYQKSFAGSDNWGNFAAADGTTYGVWGDGNLPGTARRSIGLAQLTNKVPGAITGATRIGAGGSWCAGFQVIGNDFHDASTSDPYLHAKAYGGLIRSNVIHLLTTPKSLSSTPGGTDYFRYRKSPTPATLTSWSRSTWLWTKEQGLCTPAFLRGGPGHTLAYDTAYIYAYCCRYNPFNGEIRLHKPGGFYLVRLPVALDGLVEGNWQWFNGMTGGEGGTPIWSNSINSKKLVFEEPDGMGVKISAIFDSVIGRVILMYEHTEANLCRCKIIEAEYPWGPFRRVFRGQLIDPQNRHDDELFYYQPLEGSFDVTHENFTLITTGTGTADALIAVAAGWTVN